MKNECSIVKDILPLYVEDMVSDDTKVFVENHISECTDCRKEMEKMKKSLKTDEKTYAAPLKSLKKQLKKKRKETILFTAALAAAVIISIFAYMTAPRYFAYSSSLFSLNETAEGIINIEFNDRVTGYACHKEMDADSGKSIYNIEAWETLWDKYFADRGKQNIMIKFSPEKDDSIWYIQNNSDDDILIYGEHSGYAGKITLPRLALGYYLILSAAAFVFLAVLRIMLRKNNTAKRWTERALFIPAAYILAHMCIKGWSTFSYSFTRDFAAILMSAAAFYCALLAGVGICREKYNDHLENKNFE